MAPDQVEIKPIKIQIVPPPVEEQPQIVIEDLEESSGVKRSLSVEEIKQGAIANNDDNIDAVSYRDFQNPQVH